jgi:hypothetical protein
VDLQIADAAVMGDRNLPDQSVGLGGNKRQFISVHSQAIARGFSIPKKSQLWRSKKGLFHKMGAIEKLQLQGAYGHPFSFLSLCLLPYPIP